MNVLNTASRQYASRPADERFPDVAALVAHSLEQKNHSAERTFNLKDLSAEPGPAGDLMLRGPNGSASFTHWSFGQFARSLGAPASYLRAGLPPELAADCLNYGISQSAPGTDLNLLLKQPNGSPTPIVRAATSDKYGRVWDADLYGAVAQNIAGRDGWALPPTWSGEPAGAYAGDRDSFLILCNGGSIVTDPTLTSTGNDQMFRGILIKNSEVGSSSVVIDTILYRYVCGNHMLWGAVIDKSFRRRHIGSNVTREVIREISRIAHNWTTQSPARDQAIINALITHQIAATKEGVIDELRSFGATREQATAAYDSCERNEPSASPRSFWGAAQGITRISQDTTHQDERYELDRLAAAVLARGARLVRV